MRYLKRLTSVAMVGVLAVWFVLFRPVALGGPAGYEIVTGTSMEPVLHTGDLVITESRPAYGIGDVIVFRVPSGQPGEGASVIHRIIGGDATGGFIMKGDNKLAPDPWHPKARDVVGRSWIHLPGSGWLILVLRSPLVLATVLGGLAGYWFLTSGSRPKTSREASGRGWLASGQRRRDSVQHEAEEP